MGEFDGQAAFITGGGSGIGRAAAMLFAERGARVAVVDLHQPETVADEIRARGGEAIALTADVADFASVTDAVAQTVAAFGSLDCALNNAGIHMMADAQWDLDAFDRIIAVNLRGTMNCIKAQVPVMLKQGRGAIVAVSSQAGFISSGDPAYPAYTSSKHGIIGLIKTAALAYATQGIRVNGIAPGVTDTPLIAEAMSTPSGRAALDAVCPIGRPADPREIAEAALWFCSGRASYVIGHTLVVDGGGIIQ